MFRSYSKLRRHAERIVGVEAGIHHPDIGMWMGRLRKAIQAGDLPARRQGERGDYLATWKEVERWLRTEFREVAC